MKTFLAILVLTTTVFGGKSHPESENLAFKKAIERQIRSLNIPVPSENARVFSQEDQLFPARYFYPTYPEYVDSRFTAYNTKLAPASADQPISSLSSAWTRLIPITSFALLYGAKAGIYLFSVLLILIVGVVFTTTICTFTPLCTISFPAFELTKNQVSIIQKFPISNMAISYSSN